MGKKNRDGHGWMGHLGDDGYDQYNTEGGWSGTQWNGTKGNTVSTYKRGWDTGDAPKVCTNCDFHSSTEKQKFLIDHEVWRALMSICSSVKLEWQALLTGEIKPDGTIHITGYYIPKQEVTASSVKNLDLIDDVVIAEKCIIAGVHSHGNMACFFSSTDVEDTNLSLIKHHIVVNNRSEYKAQSRVDLPCGMAKFIEGEVFTIGEPDVTIVGLENIGERKFGFMSAIDAKTEPTTGVEGGLRWCNTCGMCPEEDGGVNCTCWTKNVRFMLPEFTDENYERKHGRTFELKSHLANKYKDFRGQ